MRHRGADVGNFFLAGKEGGQKFTDDDEEVVMLFASQAAAAIANARTHRNEQRARADLEALVETSPVGVVVFDAQTGQPTRFNREARRIGEGLRIPGRPPEQALEVMTYRRADGREVSLSEFPLAEQFGDGETVRAEEVVLSVPDGRSVRTLINSTPIRSAAGTVESVVVTMQDLAPLDEIERMRTEFLGLVSHELRAPLIAIKGSADALLEEEAKLDRAEMREFHRIIAEQAGHMRGLIRDLLDAGRIDAGTLSVAPEPSDVSVLVERARSTFLSGGGRHAVLVDLPAGLPPVMADRRRICAGAQQPVVERRAARARADPDPGGGRARGRARRRLGLRRGERRGARAVAAPVQQARRRGAGRDGGPRPRARHLEGARRGPRRPHPGRQPRRRPRHGGHVHDSGGGGNRRRGGRPCRRRAGRPRTRRAAAHPRRRRRPADAALRPRRALQGWLRSAGHGHAAGPAANHPDREATPRAARPDPARRRRHRADAAGPRARRPAGHLHLRLPPRRDRCQGARLGRGRLHRQALLADRAGRPGPGRGSGAARRPSRSPLATSRSTTSGAG